MNRDQARDKLIDYLYGELPPEQAAALEAVLREDGELRDELVDLRATRAALAAHRAAEPAAAPPIPTTARRSAWRVWLPLAAAAAILVGVAAWLLRDQPVSITPPVIAGPVEIRRIGVSLTILSEPPDRGPRPYPQAMQQRLAPVQREVPYDGQVAMQSKFRGGWAGLALVRDSRLVTNLPAGVSEVRFTDVPAGIWPDSVRLAPRDGGRLDILEQNYQYDLAAAEAVLDRYVDQPVTLLYKDGREQTGVLLSFSGRDLVLQPPGEGPCTITRRQLQAVCFAKLPAGLLSKPTLLWQLHSEAAAPQKPLEVAYLTEGLMWRADYILKLHPGGIERMRNGEPEAEEPAIIDSADLVGYATITNVSGVAFEHAQLKLMAGDVNLIQPEPEVILAPAAADSLEAPGGGAGFEEKAFFEYHLYTLQRKTSLADNETKQIEMVSGSNLKMQRAYVYDRSVNATAARVVSELVNSEENGLGKPLPKGVLRLYAPDPTGRQTYVAQTTIDHTPKDEKLRLPWGFAFDIVCAARRTHYRRSGPRGSETLQYTLRNHKDYGVTVTVIVRVPPSTFRFDCPRPWHQREVGWIEIPVPVAAGTQQQVTVTYEYDSRSGGGLVSPTTQPASPPKPVLRRTPKPEW